MTPSLLRHSLARLCDSIDEQTCTDWEHIIAVDEPSGRLDDVAHPQRKILWCGRHRDWGNTPRWMAWDHAQGDYLLYIDDDNYLADPDVLDTLRFVTGPVALFPLEVEGKFVHPLPVEVGRSDGNGLIVRRDIGRWPVSDRRSADGELIAALVSAHPACPVYDDRALVVYERARLGAV